MKYAVTCLSAVILLVLGAAGGSPVFAACSKPAGSIMAETWTFGKLCCPSGFTLEPGEEENPCFAGDTFACWARITHMPAHYDECLLPSTLFECVDIELEIEFWTSDCLDEECDYFVLGVMPFYAKRVRICGYPNQENSGTQFYNDLYDNAPTFDPSNPGALPPISP